MRDSKNGYFVVTPLERAGDASTVLVNRGWIEKKFGRQTERKASLSEGEVVVEGLLREPWKKNIFTPDNKPEIGEFYFPDVMQMAEVSGSQAVWIEETMRTLSSWLSNLSSLRERMHERTKLICKLQNPTCSKHMIERLVESR